MQVTCRLWQENLFFFENKFHHQLDGVAVVYSSEYPYTDLKYFPLDFWKKNVMTSR